MSTPDNELNDLVREIGSVCGDEALGRTSPERAEGADALRAALERLDSDEPPPADVGDDGGVPATPDDEMARRPIDDREVMSPIMTEAAAAGETGAEPARIDLALPSRQSLDVMPTTDDLTGANEPEAIVPPGETTRLDAPRPDAGATEPAVSELIPSRSSLPDPMSSPGIPSGDAPFDDRHGDGEAPSDAPEPSASSTVAPEPAQIPTNDDHDPESDPPAEAAPHARESTDSALREADGTLAGDVEEILHGNFDTVSEVLEGQFDEPPAVPADDSGKSPAAPPDEMIGEVVLPDTSILSSASSFTPPRSGTATGTLPDGKNEALPARQEMAESELLPSRWVPEDMPAADPTAAEIEAEPLTLADDHPAEASPDDLPPLDFPTDAAAPAPPRARVLEPIVVEMLEVLNFPLRLLPPRVRPVLDWIALSLIFWVPIVWFVAIFVIGE